MLLLCAIFFFHTHTHTHSSNHFLRKLTEQFFFFLATFSNKKKILVRIDSVRYHSMSICAKCKIKFLTVIENQFFLQN